MLNKPVVELVNELHWLGRRLAVLRRLYQSYELILTRVLQRQRLLRDEARSRHQKMPHGHITQREPELSSNPENSVGVRLSSAAVARFERLLDRIKLYCLSEIDACLTEKESLTFLVSNTSSL
jgi:UTP:GlnB (protein PII) uridylyltransferase